MDLGISDGQSHDMRRLTRYERAESIEQTIRSSLRGVSTDSSYLLGLAQKWNIDSVLQSSIRSRAVLRMKIP